MPHQQIRVLHVDDEPDFANLTENFLQNEDDRFVVETATSADEGLETLNDRPPDCVVSDYNMPGMDGIEFLEAVREGHPDLPFILFTGKGSEEVASDAISTGATDYLQKQSGTDQYSLLANRVLNAVTQYRSEKRLQETRKEYTTVFENAQNALILVDIEDDGFRYRQCNPKAAELIGRDHSEIVGERPREALGLENGRKVVESYRECVQQRESVPYTVTLDLPVGRVTRDCEVTPVFSEGEIAKLVVEFRDITEQRERQRDLDKVETLFQHAQDSLFLIDVSDEFIIERVNPAYEDATGVSASDIQGQTPEQLLGEQQGTAVEARYGECVERREPLQYTEQLQFGSEPSYWETRIAPVVIEDTVEYIAGSTRDITEQRQQERENNRRRRRLEQILKTVPGCVVQLDADGRFVFANDRAEEVLGLDSDDVTGRTYNDPRWSLRDSDGNQIPDEELPFRQIRETGEPVYGERLNIEWPDGTRKLILVNGAPVSDDHGTFESAVFSLIDITDRKERQQELGQTRDLMANMEELADAGAWEYSSEAERLMITDGIRRLYGLGPDAAPTLEEALDAVHPEDRDLLADRLDTCLETGEPYEIEVRLTPQDGRQRLITVRGERVERDESGNVIRGYIQDVTEERRQRMQLAETAARLEALFDRSPDMIDVHDTDGNILDANQRLVERTGYAKSELTEMKIWDLDAQITPEDARTIWRKMDPDDRRQLEGVYQCRDGSTFPVEVHIRRLDVEDRDLFVAISRDITEQTERERDLSTQNERLAEFASIVSHDLRNPLGVAEDYLELAATTDETEHIAKAADALERSQALIDDLLTLAREGDHVDEFERVEIAEIAESSWETTETKSATLDATTTRTIRADRSRLQQLFENLYRNSVEHGSTSSRPEADDAVEHGGEDVTVSVGAIDDGFYVADTGAGIAESEREEIFEAGYSTDEDGTGFGLRIVEQIAEAHGWEITVTESEHGGARFEFTGVERGD